MVAKKPMLTDVYILANGGDNNIPFQSNIEEVKPFRLA